MGDQNLAEILKVKKQFVAMGTLVSSQIHQATKSFLEHDMILAKQVISKDQQVNQTEVELEKNVFDVLIRKNPMASDFREIMSILKASSDMERIGDAAIRIARQTLRMSDKPTFTAAEKLIQQLTYQVRQMLDKVDEAYVNDDSDAAYAVASEDIKVDRLYLQLRQLVLSQQVKDKQQLKASDVYLIISRQLERVGDHIVNVAEWIVYAQTGKIVELNPGKNDPELIKK